VTATGRAWLLLSVLLVAAGCGGPSKTAHPPVLPEGARGTDLVRISLFSTPIALNLDNDPGVDGFSLKLFASDRSNPKPVALPPGVLRLVQFEGRITAESKSTHDWVFATEALKTNAFQAAIGIGYQFLLRWTNDLPKSRTISVFAEFEAATGQRLVSKPTLITVHDLPAR
jgi:hypothetical protein